MNSRFILCLTRINVQNLIGTYVIKSERDVCKMVIKKNRQIFEVQIFIETALLQKMK